MPALLGQLKDSLEQLATPFVLLQLAMLGSIVIAAINLGRALHRSAAAQRFTTAPGIKNRLLEAVFIVNPHFIALLLTTATAGFLHAFGHAPHLLDACISLIALLLL